MINSVHLTSLGEGVDEAIIVRWLKNEGDRVEVDEPLVEVAAEKIEAEIRSPYAGVLRKIVAAEDEAVRIGGLLSTIEVETQNEAPILRTSHAYITPLVNKEAWMNGIDPRTITGTGVGGRVRKQDVLDEVERRRLSARAEDLAGTSSPENVVRKPSQHIERKILQSDAHEISGQGSGIFISYRRSDEPAFAGRIYDRLAHKFGRDQVFMDVDSIDLGLDFVDVIENSLSQCKALLVVMGPLWLDARDPTGSRRLEDPNDFVRMEVEAALRRDIRVIPLLVEGSQMPWASRLPNSLQSLARRNGRPMTNLTFGSDCQRLIDTLTRILGLEEAPPDA